jgi:5-methylcytosine-specific restriction endonuclease McrA
MVHPNSLKNLEKGNRYQKGYHHTQGEKERQRQWMLNNNPFRGKKHSQKTKEIMIEKARLRIGEKSSHWKGGITALRKRIKQCFRYRQWRSDVYTKDNWTCQKCGRKVREIEAHHIIPFEKILKEYNIKTLEDALKCEKLWDINNGITFCFDCHEEKHTCLKNLKNRNICVE